MYLKASYTVEGSVIISLCIIVIGMCILLGFDIYKESIRYIENNPVETFDVVAAFREINAGQGVLDGVLRR